jgi:hypothetical protein
VHSSNSRGVRLLFAFECDRSTALFLCRHARQIPGILIITIVNAGLRPRAFRHFLFMMRRNKSAGSADFQSALGSQRMLQTSSSPGRKSAMEVRWHYDKAMELDAWVALGSS